MIAFVTSVVPWTTRRTSENSRPAGSSVSASTVSTPTEGSSGVVSVLPTATTRSPSTRQRSVNVPPMSTPARNVELGLPRRPAVERPCPAATLSGRRLDGSPHRGEQVEQPLGLMRRGRPENGKLDADVAELLDAGAHLLRRAACRHALDVRVGHGLDQGLLAAPVPGLLEDGNVLAPDVRLAHLHLRLRDERQLDRVELARDLPLDRLDRGVVVVLDRAVDQLGDLELRPVATGFLGRLADDGERVR